jgi:predicted ribosome quality control (RQC) complex YloA/Tae2 family protein
MRIPFDSLTLCAVVTELQAFVGAKVQRISQLDDFTVVLGLYADGHESYLLLSCDPEFARVHLATRRPPNLPEPPSFCAVLRSKLSQARLRRVTQLGFDRIAEMVFEQPEDEYRLVAELMGKHSNLMLVDRSGRIAGVAKPVGAATSSRVVLIGRPYEPPPLEPRPSLALAKPGDDLARFEGASPFLQKLIKAIGDEGLAQVQRAMNEREFTPVLSPGNGAYSISVAPMGLPEFPRASISIALEQHYALAIPSHQAAQLRTSLASQLKRVLLARETAIGDLLQAQDAAARAGESQLRGELILTYGPALESGSSSLEAVDYEGKNITIKLDPELGYVENAGKYFDKAKRAKARQGIVVDQLQRLSEDRARLEGFIARIESEERLDVLQELKQQARERKWLHVQRLPTTKKEDRPYEGHRIRELLGPGGATVLYGENATSNDYLTLRIAKPDDYWLHVRGSVSAHVVIKTNKQPEKVGKELLQFAAKIAVQNSPSKHSGYVPVDYTLKKYVRKPKSAPPGTALYTHEKTLHIEG